MIDRFENKTFNKGMGKLVLDPTFQSKLENLWGRKAGIPIPKSTKKKTKKRIKVTRPTVIGGDDANEMVNPVSNVPVSSNIPVNRTSTPVNVNPTHIVQKGSHVNPTLIEKMMEQQLLSQELLIQQCKMQNKLLQHFMENQKIPVDSLETKLHRLNNQLERKNRSMSQITYKTPLKKTHLKEIPIEKTKAEKPRTLMYASTGFVQDIPISSKTDTHESLSIVYVNGHPTYRKTSTQNARVQYSSRRARRQRLAQKRGSQPR